MRETNVACPLTGCRMSAEQRLRRPPVRLNELLASGQVEIECGAPCDTDIITLETSVKYEGYLRREEAHVARALREERRRIPGGFSYRGLAGLTNEMVERLSEVRPETLGQAGRIPGVTPAAVAVLAMHVERYNRRQRPSHDEP